MAAAIVATAIVAACSTPRPPELDDNSGADGGALDATITFSADASSYGPPGCGVVDGGRVCDCVDQTPLLTDIPNIYFFLDRSGSMSEDDKWDTVRKVVGDTLLALGPRTNVGLATFPHYQMNGCTPGVEMVSMRPGDAPAGTRGPTYLSFDVACNMLPAGGTPTAATLSALLPTLQGLSGRTFAILATDGGPNCNLDLTCSVTTCTRNMDNLPGSGCVANTPPNCCDPAVAGVGANAECLDDVATRDAVQAFAAAGIPVYIIGVPGSAPYATLLNDLAVAGNTAQMNGPPFYYAVDSTDIAAFAKALDAIAAKITASCTLTLSKPPDDPTRVNVWINQTLVPQDAANGGWSLSGATVTLVGQTCADVLSGKSLDVRIIAGCPTIVN
jgi:hypothetical protein